MATRSNIALKTAEGTWLSIYVHWDGYPSNMLPILNNHYKDYDKTLKMIMQGNRSFLNTPDETPKLYDEAPTRNFNKPEIKEDHIYYGELNPDTNVIEWSYK